MEGAYSSLKSNLPIRMEQFELPHLSHWSPFSCPDQTTKSSVSGSDRGPRNHWSQTHGCHSGRAVPSPTIVWHHGTDVEVTQGGIFLRDDRPAPRSARSSKLLGGGGREAATPAEVPISHGLRVLGIGAQKLMITGQVVRIWYCSERPQWPHLPGRPVSDAAQLRNLMVLMLMSGVHWVGPWIFRGAS